MTDESKTPTTALDVRPKRPLKLVTFDLDDTVWHCAPIIERARARMFALMASEYPLITEELVFEMRGQTDFRSPEIAYDFSKMMRAVLRKCCARVGYDPDVAVEPMFMEYYTNRNKVDDHLFPGALSTIDKVRSRRLKVGAISNGNSNVDSIESLSGRFDFRVNPGICGHSKHGVEPYEFAKNLAGIDFSVHSGVHIGDNYNEDVVVAKKAGFFTVWIDNRDLLHELRNKGVHIGDNYNEDVVVAKKAGFFTVWIDNRDLLHELNEKLAKLEQAPQSSNKSSSTSSRPASGDRSETSGSHSAGEGETSGLHSDGKDEARASHSTGEGETSGSHSAAKERERALQASRPVFTDDHPCEADLVIGSISEWETLAAFFDTFPADSES